MKRTFKLFAFAAVAVAVLIGCQKENKQTEPEIIGQFTVTADAVESVDPATGKTAFVDGDASYVKWLSDDKIRVYEFIDGTYNAYFNTAENGTHLSNDGKTATFDVSLYGDDKKGATSYCYTAIYPADGVGYNKDSDFYYFEIPASQTLVGGNFAAGSDVLIGKPVNMASRISTTTNLEVKFKRPGTVVALTLKGITADETISSVKITAPAGQKIAGRSKVDLLTGEVSDKAYYGGTNVISLNCGDAVATGDDKFYFRCLDGTWTSGSEVSISVETDKAYYSKTVNLPKDYVFTDGGLTKFGFQGMTREAKSTGTPYTLVTSASDLCDGASYIFVGIKNEEYYAMTEQNTNNRRSAKVSAPVDNVITLPSSTGAYTFQLEEVTDGWAIKDITTGSSTINKYLYAAASGNNYMKSQDNVDKNATWTITISDNKASINAEKSTNRHCMQFNASGNSTLFSCYSSASQSPIYLYVDKSTVKEKVATPVLSEGSAAAGEVAVGTVIKLTCATEGAAIHYTVDGTEPTAASATYTDAGITINDDCTIKAIGVKDGYSDSDVLTLEYTVKVVADPVISFEGTTVKITCETIGATIHYVIGGDDVSDPTSSSPVYDPSNKPSVSDGQTVKAIAMKEGEKDSQITSLKYTSAPVVLTTVTVSGEPTKKTYTAGDSFEPAGLTVTGTYSDGNQEVITEGITWSEPAALTAGQTSVTITATVSDITSAGYTVEGLTVNPKGNPKYVKVTSTADLTDGTYLIICESQNVAFNGALTTLDAVSNTVAVTISNNEIATSIAVDAAAFTFTASNGSFKGTGGKYFGNASNSNALTSSTTALANTVSINDGNADIVSSGGAYLRYNKAANQTRFRYYKSSTYSAQEAIQLYKLTN